MGIGIGQLISPVSLVARAYARWFEGVVIGFSQASITFDEIGRVVLAPVEILWPVTIDELLYCVGATQAGNVRLALYEDGPAGDIPDGGALVVESASVAQVVTANIQGVAVIAMIVTPGLYWFALMADDITGTYVGYRDSSFLLGRRFVNSVGYGAFDNPCPATVGLTNRPACLVGISENLPMP